MYVCCTGPKAFKLKSRLGWNGVQRLGFIVSGQGVQIEVMRLVLACNKDRSTCAYKTVRVRLQERATCWACVPASSPMYQHARPTA